MSPIENSFSRWDLSFASPRSHFPTDLGFETRLLNPVFGLANSLLSDHNKLLIALTLGVVTNAVFASAAAEKHSSTAPRRLLWIADFLPGCF